MTKGDDDTAITVLIGQLADDARAYALAEVAVLKARTGATVGRYRTAAVFFGAAGVLAFAGFVALLVGLILTLSPHTGPGVATLIVVGVVCVVAIVLGLLGKTKLGTPAP